MSRLGAAIEAIQNAVTKDDAFAQFCGFVGLHGYDRAVFSLMTDHDSAGLSARHGLSTTYPED